MMRKALMILLTTAALVSCDKGVMDNPTEESPSLETEITFNLTAHHPDGAATKAVKTGWEAGDVIFVFFNNVAAPKYLKMSYDGSVWSNTQMNGTVEGTLGLAEGSTGSMRAVYLPFGNALTVGAEGTSFTFSETTYSYYLTGTLGYAVTDGEVSGAFDMYIPEGYVQFFLDDADASEATEIELREPHLTPQGIASISADGTITHTSMAHGAPLKGYVYDKAVKETGESKGYLFSGILSTDARNTPADYRFTLVSGGWQGLYYQKAFLGKTWYRSAAEGRALKMPALSNWLPLPDNQPIDLGIDVDGKRIYWGSCNVGATKPEDGGDYFAWGETAPYYPEGHAQDNPCSVWATGKSGYDWDSYSWGFDGPVHFMLTKYCPSGMADYWVGEGVPDNLLDLADGDYVDDAARQILGGGWRIPTREEWAALVELCDWTYINWEGMAGCQVAGPGGENIFLPAAGYRKDAGIDDTVSYGCYWSSSIKADAPSDAWYMFFKEDHFKGEFASARYYGHSVRPVTE